MSECDLRITEFQLGMLAALIHKERMQVYDDQLMIDALKDILSRIVKAKTDVEKQVWTTVTRFKSYYIRIETHDWQQCSRLVFPVV